MLNSLNFNLRNFKVRFHYEKNNRNRPIRITILSITTHTNTWYSNILYFIKTNSQVLSYKIKKLIILKFFLRFNPRTGQVSEPISVEKTLGWALSTLNSPHQLFHTGCPEHKNPRMSVREKTEKLFPTYSFKTWIT